MIILLIYLIGIYITPIILKKCFSSFIKDSDEEDRDMLIVAISITWPISLGLRLLFILLSFTVWIYNKI